MIGPREQSPFEHPDDIERRERGYPSRALETAVALCPENYALHVSMTENLGHTVRVRGILFELVGHDLHGYSLYRAVYVGNVTLFSWSPRTELPRLTVSSAHRPIKPGHVYFCNPRSQNQLLYHGRDLDFGGGDIPL